MKYRGHINIMKKILYDEEYENLSLKAIVCGGILYDRYKLSIIKGFADERGEICLIFPQENLKKPLRCCEKTVGKILQELENHDLITRHHQRLTRQDIIYVTEKLCKIFTSEEENFTSQDKTDLHINNIYSNNNENIDKDQIFMMLNEKWNFHEIASISESHQELIGIVFDVAIDLLSSSDKEIYIAGKIRSANDVIMTIAKLTSFHIVKIIDRIIERIDEIDDLRLYVVTSLYNSGNKIPDKRS